jgi:oligopeptide transport system substrate-binding protein
VERSLEPAVDTQTVVYNMSSQPKSIDPAKTTELISGAVIAHVFEGLTNTGPNSSVLPGVAERWEVSADGLTYDFYLRDNAQWSDGAPVTARDFVYAWTRLLAPETGSLYATVFSFLKGAEQFNTVEGTDASVLGFEAVDDHHLRVRLEHPTSYFLQLTSFMCLMPLRRDIVEAHPEDWTLRPETYIGNGAFKMTHYERDYEVVMEPNPHYWDRDSTHIQRLVWYQIQTSQSEYIAYLTNSIDITYGVPYPDLPEIRARLPEHLHNIPWIGTYYVGFNLRPEHPEFQDPRVRRALALALDRARIAREVTAGTRRGAVTWIPPGIPDADGVSDFAADSGVLVPNAATEEARRLMAEAGYPNGRGFPQVTYSFNTDADHAKVAEMLQAAWRRVLNIDVRLENQEWQVYLDNHRNGNFQFGRASWIGDYVDPMTFLSIWLSYDTSNRNGYANAEYDHLVEEAQRTQDRQRYFELCHEAERVLMDDMALIPIYYYANTFLQNPALDGLIYTALGTPLFHHARWNVDMIRAAEEAG